MRKWKKGVGLILALVLAAGFLPVHVFADETEEETVPETVSEWAIDEQNFPDEHFRTYVLENWDENGDETLSKKEAGKAEKIDVSGLEIASLQGIECFRNLRKLDCSANGLTWLDLTGLEKLRQLRCQGNALTELNLEQCPALEELYCSTNALTALRFNDNPNLTTLLCQDNRLELLEISDCPALEYLFCFDNCLPFLNLSANEQLTDLQAQDNISPRPELLDSRQLDLSTLADFDLTRASGWKNAILAGTVLTVDEFASSVSFAYDVTGRGEKETFTWIVPKPEGINIDEENFPDDNFRLFLSQTLDLGKDRVLTPEEIAAVETLDCSGWRIGSLAGIEHFTQLQTLNCGNNDLAFLDVSGCPNLTQLEGEGNTAVVEVTRDGLLDLTKIPGFDPRRANDWVGGTVTGNLLTLDENAERLTFTYDVDGESGEKSVDFTWEIRATESRDAAISEENFPDEVFRSCILENIDTDGNEILSEREADAVTRLYLEELGISSLAGLEYFPHLQELYCGFNQLKKLDVSGCANLTTLNCDRNGLKSLTLPSGENLAILSCTGNRLTELDIRDCLGLTWLFCENNRLKVLDVTTNEHLEKLRCDEGILRETSPEEQEELPTGEPEEEPQTEVPACTAGHKFAPWCSVILPTCHSEGTLGHSTCTVCGRYFDANGRELTDLVIPMAPDRHGTTEKVPAVKPTCTEDGLTAGVRCLDCGAFVSGHTPVPAAHTLGAWVIGSQDTPGHFECTVCGRFFDANHREMTP